MSLSAPSEESMRTFAGLCELVAGLRGPDGCPWDRVQTPESLRPYLLEEVAEVLEALDSGDPSKLREELADLLFEVVLQVQLASEQGAFKMGDVIHDVSSKLVRRHPHVFADSSADTPEAVIEQWDSLKAEERGRQSAVAGIPATLPALAHAQALQRRVARVGFEWDSDEQFWAALEEELGEFRAADDETRAAEAGDTLFALVNLVRRSGIDAEDALRIASRRFVARFMRVEQIANERRIELTETNLSAKLALWDEAKTGG